MPEERSQYQTAGQSATPESMKPRKKRRAPGADIPIRQSPERQAARYGRPTTFRIPDDVRRELEAQAKRHGIAKRDLVLYFVVKGLLALRGGSLELPIVEDEQRRLEVPEIPENEGD